MRHREFMRFSFGLAAIVASSLVLSCAKERMIPPVADSFRLYVGMNPTSPNWKGHIVAIDCETDDVVDSLSRPEWTNSWSVMSTLAAPGTLVIPHESTDYVFDAVRNELITSLGSRFSSIVNFPEVGRIFGGGGDNSIIFEDTTYSVRGTYRQVLRDCRRVAQTSKVIGRARFQPGGPPYGPFVIYDITARTLIDSFVVDPHNDGRGFAFYGFDLSPDGERLYAGGEVAGTGWVLGFEIATRQVLFMYPQVGISGPGICFVNPDAPEVWVTWSANIYGYPWPQSVHILNSFDGTLLDTIDVSHATLNWPRLVSPTSVQFVPGGSKAYISCGTNTTGFQPLLAVRTDTRQILKVFYPEADRIPRVIAVGPAP